MKTMSKIFASVLILAVLTFSAGFTAKVETAVKLKITNKTKSRIDEVHVGGSGDILASDEVLEPNETVEITFSGCEGNEDMEATVELVFVDGSHFSFEDTVCDGDFAWDITQDGK